MVVIVLKLGGNNGLFGSLGSFFVAQTGHGAVGLHDLGKYL